MAALCVTIYSAMMWQETAPLSPVDQVQGIQKSLLFLDPTSELYGWSGHKYERYAMRSCTI